MITIVSEKNKSFEDIKQAVIELAFCHYPVTVRIEKDDKTEEKAFDSFDSARLWLQQRTTA